MALPDGFLDELRLRSPLAAVIGRKVKLARSGRQLKGCCPFHGEKTPSFYVYDDHYHCFGCGAHGDAIGFVMQSQGTGFMEAVEQLAAEAGLTVPKPTPQAEEAERRRLDLTGVLEAAQATYRRRLFLPEGREALAYLHHRGLTDETIESFGLGWSGEGRGTLLADLARQDITPARLVEAGLLRQDDATGRSFELFFNRVMFPIRDRRGRMISFGGRILGDGQPKYLNGPETAAFSKRRTLYGLDLARTAVRGGAPLVLVEGYLDVIAMTQAGLGGAVAPLGTALTEEQLQELWRLSPTPLLCFDGDAAGGRAAARAAELALPLLATDRTLKFVSLPAGEDPDTLIRRRGAEAMRAALDSARPLANTLYDLLGLAGDDGTPERRAAFRQRLEAAAGQIPDRNLAREYRQALLDRFFASRRNPKANAKQATSPSRPSPTSVGDMAAAERTRILSAILLRHPGVVHDVEHAFATLELPDSLGKLRHALFAWIEQADMLDSQALISHLTLSGLQAEVEQALAPVPVPLPACASETAMPAEAEAGWWHIFGFLNVARLREEVTLAEAACAQNLTLQTQNRLLALKDALNKVTSGEPDGVDLAA